MKTPFGYGVGDMVYDLLTDSAIVKVKGIKYEEGNFGGKETNAGSWGIWVDSEYLDGARHPWEVDAGVYEL